MAIINYSDNEEIRPGSGVLDVKQEENWDWYKKLNERKSFPDTVTCPDSTLILVGPATYAEIIPSGDGEITGDNELLAPVGFVDNFSINDSNQVVASGEIGSRMPRFVVDHNSTQATIRRAMFDANSLTTALYKIAINKTGKGFDNLADSPVESGPATGAQKEPTRFKMGIWSDMFRVPFGMCICYKSVGNDYLGSVYLEECYISSYSTGVSVGSAMVLEDAQLEFERVKNVKVQVGFDELSGVHKATGAEEFGPGNGQNFPAS